MAYKRAIFEEGDDKFDGGFPPDLSAPSTTQSNQGDDDGFNPPDHPWDYTGEAKAKVVDYVLMPDRKNLRRFNFMPEGIIFEMCLGDAIVETMRRYNDPTFLAPEAVLEFIDNRLCARKGWLAQLATLMAHEGESEEINPATGPQL